MEIMIDVLNACMERRQKTHLMLRTRLNYAQVMYYIHLLSCGGFIKQCIQEGVVYYVTTIRGKLLLSQYAQIMQLIGDHLDGNEMI